MLHHCLPVETILLGALACPLPTILAVGGGQSERETSFFNHKLLATCFRIRVCQFADSRMLVAVFSQPVFQICVVSADMDNWRLLIKPNIRGLFLLCQSCFHWNSFFALCSEMGHFSVIFSGS